MKDSKTVIVNIIDRSGSMSGLEESTISGFNKFINSQKEQQGEVEVNTILFDDQFQVLHNELPLEHVPEMTKKEYYTRGSTALVDALGRSIHKIESRIKKSAGITSADKIIFMIITDGQENASNQYTFDIIKRLISAHTEKDNWDFIFLGANMDAVKESAKYGIRGDRTMNYRANRKGVDHAYGAMSSFVTNIRSSVDFDTRASELDDKDQKAK